MSDIGVQDRRIDGCEKGRSSQKRKVVRPGRTCTYPDSRKG
jgi:hypothetical protein